MVLAVACKWLKINDCGTLHNKIRQNRINILRMGNNPMVGATVAVAVSVEEAAKAGKF